MSAGRATRVAMSPLLRSSRVVAIVRGRSGEHLQSVCETLIEAGIRTLEITMNTPRNLEVLTRLREAHGDTVELGTGTVLSPAEVEATATAGGTFVVSPAVDLVVGETASRLGVAWYPGAMTPTEALRAWNAGATAVKLFPAGPLGGPAYLRQVRAPLDFVDFVPTGGISLAEAGEYLRAGAVAIGVGGPLIGDSLDTGDLDGLRDRASALLAAVGSTS